MLDNKVARLMRAAASLLNLPADALDASRWSEQRAFRSYCIAFVLDALGIDRTEIAVAMDRSGGWLDKALSLVRERIDSSQPFRLSMEGLIGDLRLSSPSIQKFKEIRRSIARQGPQATADTLTMASALIVLADVFTRNGEPE
jgi:hypothetical protein